MKECITRNCAVEPMGLDCLILNPAFINKRPTRRVSNQKVRASYKKECKRKERTNDDSAIMKFGVAVAAVFALSLFI